MDWLSFSGQNSPRVTTSCRNVYTVHNTNSSSSRSGLRSASHLLYRKPALKAKFGGRAFSHAGPAAWNSLPDYTFSLSQTPNFSRNFSKLSCLHCHFNSFIYPKIKYKRRKNIVNNWNAYLQPNKPTLQPVLRVPGALPLNVWRRRMIVAIDYHIAIANQSNHGEYVWLQPINILLARSAYSVGQWANIGWHYEPDHWTERRVGNHIR